MKLGPAVKGPRRLPPPDLLKRAKPAEVVDELRWTPPVPPWWRRWPPTEWRPAWSGETVGPR